MTQQYTPAQLEAFLEPYPLKPLVLGANASMDHYETTVWERKVEAMLKRRAEAAPDLARLVLEKEKEIARLESKVEFWRGCTELARLKLEEFSIDLKRWISHQYDEPQAMKETSDE